MPLQLFFCQTAIIYQYVEKFFTTVEFGYLNPELCKLEDPVTTENFINS